METKKTAAPTKNTSSKSASTSSTVAPHNTNGKSANTNTNAKSGGANTQSNTNAKSASGNASTSSNNSTSKQTTGAKSSQSSQEQAKSMQKNATDSKSSNRTKNCAASVSYKTECAQDMCKLTDKDIISDVLGSQKSLITLYSTALCESSCKNMRDVVSTKLTECAQDQFDMFLYMNERGMYPTENATVQNLTKAKQLYAQAKQKMK